jgi:hypothetical protein
MLNWTNDEWFIIISRSYGNFSFLASHCLVHSPSHHRSDIPSALNWNLLYYKSLYFFLPLSNRCVCVVVCSVVVVRGDGWKGGIEHMCDLICFSICSSAPFSRVVIVAFPSQPPPTQRDEHHWDLWDAREWKNYYFVCNHEQQQRQILELNWIDLYAFLAAEYRHQQFIRQNLTQDYDMVNTPQDNGELIWFVREVLMKKYPMPSLPKLWVTNDDTSLNTD